MKEFVPGGIRAYNHPNLNEKGHSIQCPECGEDIKLARWRLNSQGCPNLLDPENLPLGKWACVCGLIIKHKQSGWVYEK